MSDVSLYCLFFTYCIIGYNYLFNKDASCVKCSMVHCGCIRAAQKHTFLLLLSGSMENDSLSSSRFSSLIDMSMLCSDPELVVDQ